MIQNETRQQQTKVFLKNIYLKLRQKVEKIFRKLSVEFLFLPFILCKGSLNVTFCCRKQNGHNSWGTAVKKLSFNLLDGILNFWEKIFFKLEK